MRAGGFCTFLFVLLLSGSLAAHRLDEYLQTARLAVSADAVSVELDLTPGASVAGAIAARIDRDADGAIAPAEAEAYGRTVLADLELWVNGRDVPMTLTRVESPAIGEMLDGVGTIRLTARAELTAAPSPRTIVRFANHHAADKSVYLVNALKPADDRVALERQSRDVHQQAIDLEYEVRPGRSQALGWSVLAVALVAGLIWLRT